MKRIVRRDETWVHHSESACNHKAWIGSTYHRPGQKNSKVCLLSAKWCWRCFGTLMGPSSSITRIMDGRPIVHCIVLGLKWSWNSLLAVNAEQCRQMELYCTVRALELVRW